MLRRPVSSPTQSATLAPTIGRCPASRWWKSWAATQAGSRLPLSRHGSIQTILGNPPEYVETAKVIDILMAVPKFGRVKAGRFLNTCKISPSKTVGGLSERQRTELIGLFNR